MTGGVSTVKHYVFRNYFNDSRTASTAVTKCPQLTKLYNRGSTQTVSHFTEQLFSS